MYRFKYNHRIMQAPDNYDNQTVLSAVFDFGSEVPKKDKEEVRKRCDFRTRMVNRGGIREQDIGELNRYLFEHECSGFEKTNTLLLPSQGYAGGRTYFTISSLRLGKLGIKLRVEARGHLPLEKMFDLEALNKFILTGKVDGEEGDRRETLQEQQV